MAQPSLSPNVYVVGAQCTGKTTLVNALERFYTANNDVDHSNSTKTMNGPRFIREIARSVLAKHGFTRGDITTSPSRALQLQRYILEGQHEAEHAISKSVPTA